MWRDVICQFFELALMGISPIACDVALMLYFLYWIYDPTAHDNDDLFYIFGVSQMQVLMCFRVHAQHKQT